MVSAWFYISIILYSNYSVNVSSYTILYFIVHNMYSYKQYLTQQITKMLRTCIHTYKTITTILDKMTMLSVKAQFREVEAPDSNKILPRASTSRN